MKIFTVYDSKAEAYLQPFYAQATGAGVRIFSEAASDQAHQFNKHGADYTLFEVGSFDEQSGTLKIHEAKMSLGTAQELSSKPGNGEPRRGLADTTLTPVQGGE